MNNVEYFKKHESHKINLLHLSFEWAEHFDKFIK